MKLGAFSVSLAVKDIHASKQFYEKLGFRQIGGELEQSWCILQNGEHIIGLFQGMFEKNMLTFNPGWDQQAQALDEFADVRDIQAHCKQQGLQLLSEVDPDSNGPGSFMLEDPDGNPILIDQHR
ncbi:VOC family protein [Thalassotalea mangrovi]|uniref:VOC family protein n=1 Tax=Thalassotalea mangrovi TaxID=2572245 RepID=A0A4U1B6T3_9GAMM|nr:VOC family protein [Thalassotalea mangrovi]TKB46274.1 VOC family protein [Thalassotalea mangrovi]